MGLFPGIKKPRVMWLGVGGQLESLFKLQSTLDENLEKSGFPREKRPFKGHLTLGRIKGKIDTKKLVDSMRSLKGVESDSFFADRIILFKSDLKPTGAVYTKLSSTALED
jgi:2'-5' RNA ligase